MIKPPLRTESQILHALNEQKATRGRLALQKNFVQN